MNLSRVSCDLQLGFKKVTLNHLVTILYIYINTHLAVLDPEKKGLNGLFSLPNFRNPQKFKAGIRHWLSFRICWLVGGFNPFEKYARQIGSFPQGSGV